MNTIKNEPVMTAWLASAVTVFLGLAAAFGLNLTPEQQKAITEAVPFIALIVGAVANWMARQRVTPVRRLNK